jgi:hypothetical protein
MLVESACFVRIRIRFKFEPKTPSKPFKKSFLFIFFKIFLVSRFDLNLNPRCQNPKAFFQKDSNFILNFQNLFRFIPKISSLKACGSNLNI